MDEQMLSGLDSGRRPQCVLYSDNPAPYSWVHSALLLIDELLVILAQVESWTETISRRSDHYFDNPKDDLL